MRYIPLKDLDIELESNELKDEITSISRKIDQILDKTKAYEDAMGKSDKNGGDSKTDGSE